MAAVNEWKDERRRKQWMLTNGSGDVFPWTRGGLATRKELVISPSMAVEGGGEGASRGGGRRGEAGKGGGGRCYGTWPVTMAMSLVSTRRT